MSVELSVIVPVGKRVDDLDDLHRSYVQGLDACGMAYEMIYVLDGPNFASEEVLLQIGNQQGLPNVSVIRLGRNFGEATALMTGYASSSGGMIMMLPAYFQVEGSEFPKLLGESGNFDMVVVQRSPRRGGRLARARRAGFHKMLRWITRQSFHDLGCCVRVMDRRVLDEVEIYGEQHRLLPVIAANRGFRVHEIKLAQSPRDDFRGRYPFRLYWHRILDIFTVFFLVRFTEKPLRFFGTLGGLFSGIGAVAIVVMMFQRLLLGQALADRPALLLASLLLVLGAQLFALGLLAELIIFTHARDLREHRINEIIGD